MITIGNLTRFAGFASAVSLSFVQGFASDCLDGFVSLNSAAPGPVWTANIAAIAETTDGSILATSPAGGANGRGLLFKVASDRTFTALRSFTVSEGRPTGGLSRAPSGELYGATYDGGPLGVGAVFKVSSDGHTVTFLTSFKNGKLPPLPKGQTYSAQDRLDAAGSYPLCPPIALSSGVYGVTSSANNQYYGVLYRVSGDKVKGLYFFEGKAGRKPMTLIAGPNETLIGACHQGSLPENQGGTVFTADTAGNVRVVAQFDGVEFGRPSNLCLGSDGRIYGTAQGPSNRGCVFVVQAGTLAPKILHAFKGGADGSNPIAGLVERENGWLYGATREGGERNGVIYRIKRDGSAYEVVQPFAWGSSGHAPLGNLFKHSNGLLYGISSAGGEFGSGAVYRLQPCTLPGRPGQPELSLGTRAWGNDDLVTVRTGVTASQKSVAATGAPNVISVGDGISIQIHCATEPHAVQYVRREYVLKETTVLGAEILQSGSYYLPNPADPQNVQNALAFPLTSDPSKPQWRTDSLKKPTPYFESGMSFRTDCCSLTMFDSPTFKGTPAEFAKYREFRVIAVTYVLSGKHILRQVNWQKTVKVGKALPEYKVSILRIPDPVLLSQLTGVSNAEKFAPWH